MNTSKKQLDEMRKRFLLKYWKMTIVMAVSFVAAGIVGLFVFLSFTTNAIATGFVPVSLGQWTVGYLVTFASHLIFWEIVFVISWIIPISGGFFYWYTKLPEEDKKGWKGRGRREESDAIGFLIAVAWFIMLWLDGRWNLTLESWTFMDWIYSWLTAALWVFIIFGIPIVVLFTLWIVKKAMKEETEDEPKEETVDEPTSET